LNNILIKRIDGKMIIPISDIDTLLINNYKILITIQLINALIAHNVNIIIANNKQEPNAYILPINGNHMSLKVLEKQIAWNTVYKGNS
jgi:CRISPR-associated protein Cas1